ncbi:hypothetical protein [Hymenobacter pini]|uniref:hypothetical protein n=1 Tax=Hymenobacter pini TaxID=2880879 RepID=UPI001CF4A633|nr:hypothetical protein [Hymenobacter pini]MCA8830594.1 hypothetical protein [Hymenobacter pini]
MTRASLLHILDHVNGISDAEIRELEQLAAAFPYCQTAHVLLAKASHDRGSMLASQRLRRAATYAADRELLRQLLEQPVAPQPVVTPEVPVAASAFDEPVAVVAPEPEPLPEATPVQELPATEDLLTAEPASTPALLPQDAAESVTPAKVADAEPIAEEVEPSSTETSPAYVSDTELFEIPHPDVITAPKEPVAESSSPESSAPAVEEQPAEVALSNTAEPATTETAVPEAAAEADDDVLPAVAPPIRPPADGGISRFEFGLSQPALAEPVGYQLPGLEDEEDDELPTLSSLTTAPAPVVTAPFRADADLGYALGAGSRLGYDLQAHDGYTLDLPLDAFFEPDALLLAHLKSHKPKPVSSSLDLINRFLKTQPRIKTPAGLPLPAEEQPDLSVRSTSAAPAIASESLAKIMVRQGKKDKAIEIYERLMARQPEKKAYFAEQIQQLQQPSE